MDFNEAIHIARGLKNHFKAFEKLEELLLVAANLDAAIVEKQKRVGELVKQEDAYKGAVASLDKDFEERKARRLAQIEQIENEIKSKKDALQAEYDTRIQALNDKLDAENAHCSDVLATIAGKKLAAQAELDIVRDKLQAAKLAHAEFLSKLRA